MDEVLKIIELFDEDEVTTADKIDRPQSATDREMFQDFNDRNPKADGGMLVKPSTDGSRPGYAGDAINLPNDPNKGTKSLGGGVYQNTSKKGFVSYFGKYRRKGKDIKKTFNPKDFGGSLAKAKKAAADFVKEGADVVPGKSVIELQSEQGTLLEQKKYKEELTKALAEVDKLADKGYGNIKSIVDKYMKKFSVAPGTKTIQGKISTGGETTQQRAIRFAINNYADKLDIQSIYNPKIIKALDAYTKIKKPKRGIETNIAKRFKISPGRFGAYLTTLNIRKKIPLKFGSEVEKRKYFAKLRNDAINEFSSRKFENFLQAPETALVQKSHMGDLYNQYVRTGNLGYAPNLINQEALKDADAAIKSINEKISDLYQNKPKGFIKQIDDLNRKGTDIAAATQGYKKFTGVDPYTGKEFIINFSKPSQELDPTDLFGNKKLSELTEADKPLLSDLKQSQIKAAKLSKKNVSKLNKSITDTLLKETNVKNVLSKFAAIGCPGKAKGGRVDFNIGGSTECITRGLEKVKTGTNLGPGDQANIRKLNDIAKTAKGAKAMGSAARIVSGLGLGTEAALGGFFALTDYATGADKQEIISNLTYGLAGKDMQEQLKQQDPMYGKADKLDKVFLGYLTGMDRKKGLRPGKITTESDVFKAMQPFKRPSPQSPQIDEGEFFDLDKYKTQMQKDRAAEETFAKEKTQRALERGFYDPGIGGSQRISEFAAAGGGIAGLSGGVDKGPAPESGKTPHGLLSIKNNVKKY